MTKDKLISNLQQYVVNPVLFAPGCALRDPAIYFHDNEFHFYFSLVTGLYQDRQKWFIAHSKTTDFILFSDITCISPEGYASPGNVFPHDGGFVICYQSYPRTSVSKAPGDECRLYFSKSDDLENWQSPEIVSEDGCRSEWSKQTTGWRHRQIDPYVLVKDETYYLFYKGGLHIGLWASEDLHTWRDLTPEQPLLTIGPESWSHGVENPCVIEIEGTYYLFYDSTGKYDGTKQNVFHYISSTDLVHWDPGKVTKVPRPNGAPFFIDLQESFGIYMVAFHASNGRAFTDRYITGLGIGWSDDFRNWRFLEYGKSRLLQSLP